MTTTLASLLAAAIAFLGVCIAWGQWYTARQKLVLDLFDKRSAKHEALRRAIVTFKTHGDDRLEDFMAFCIAVRDMRYLFGRDVLEALYQAEDALAAARTAELQALSSMRDDDIVASDRHFVSADDHRREFNRFVQAAEAQILPYLRMDQKLPRPPYEWPDMSIAWLKQRWANRSDGSA